ncbi:MAG: DUF5107 domain-containing protein [Oscillospiraceae bacterium]|jgi:hypothetical protein|nr:DUF5107 domain-containing protein [Oscillospiraceae bacterium]
MTELLYEQLTIPSASLGRENPLPDLKGKPDAHAAIETDETISAEESRYMGWARVSGILPYTVQDGYDREKKPREWNAVILRNDYIEATFMPQLGGRLWSLVDRTTGRELLHRNPVFQPCNLALRNAWISGGVEWNCGIIGHTPYTVSPMFAEAIEPEGGAPILRMYQYERVRDLVYRIEAALPNESRQLFVRVRIDNASTRDTAVYWWSNIAVDERPDTRVAVPADRAYRFDYTKKLSKVPVPHYRDMDASRPATLPHAMDFFFDIPQGQRKWIAAVGGDGYGLVQTSTDTLRGRKLFVWGQNAGGKHWQEFLSVKGSSYIEIQAGLASTQLEHLPLEGGGSREWTEAYGPIQIDPALARGDDWPAMTRAIDDALEAALPRLKVEATHAALSEGLPGQRGKLFQNGGGWGSLEQVLRWEDFRANGLRFPSSSMSKQQRYWQDLVFDGALPAHDPLDPPTAYQVGDLWLERLRASVDSGKGDHWFSRYHLGVMRAYRFDDGMAEAEFTRSMELTPNPWAARGLAVLKARAGDLQSAADMTLDALKLAGSTPPKQLAIETLSALNEAGRYGETDKVARSLPRSIASLGRVKALRVKALLELGDAAEAERVLRGRIVLTDVREGEISLSDLWKRLCEVKGVSLEDNPIPASLDFRMRDE